MGLRRRSRFSVAIAGAKVGFELSLACDFRLVSETCLYALPEQRRGQIPGSDGAARLQKMIGITRAKDIVMRSRRITGRQACDWGVATDCVPDGELDAATDAFVDELRDFAPLAQRTAKKLLNDIEDAPLSLAIELEGQCYCGKTRRPSLLAGMLFDGDGNRMTPSHTVKKGTRYRYYVSRSLITKDRTEDSAGLRVPAAEIEQLVTSRVRQWLLDRGSIYKATSARFPDPSTQRRLAARAAAVGKRWPELPVTRTRAVLAALIERIEVSVDQIEIRLRPRQLNALPRCCCNPNTGRDR